MLSPVRSRPHETYEKQVNNKMRDQEKLFPATVMPDPDWWQALWPDPLNVLRKIGFKEGITAIDLCCGDGLFTAPMSVLLGGRVYAVDLDPHMLALAKQAVKDAGAPSCTFIEGDARDMAQLIPVNVDIILINILRIMFNASFAFSAPLTKFSPKTIPNSLACFLPSLNDLIPFLIITVTAPPDLPKAALATRA